MYQNSALQYFSLTLLQHQLLATNQVTIFFSHTTPTPDSSSSLPKSSDPEKSMELDFYHGNFAAVLYSVAWLVMELALCGCTPRCTRPNFPRIKQSLSRLPKKLPFQIRNNPFLVLKQKNSLYFTARETSSTVYTHDPLLPQRPPVSQ